MNITDDPLMMQSELYMQTWELCPLCRISEMAPFVFHSLYTYTYFIPTPKVEMVHKINLTVFILLLGMSTLYQNSLLLACC